MTHRIQFLFAACVMFAITLMMVPTASAQDEGGVCGIADVQACLDACSAYATALSEDDESTEDEIIEHCTALPACTAVSMTAARLRSAGTICHSVFGRTRTPVVAPSTARTGDLPGFCILPDGTGVADEGSRRCGCPAGTFPLAVSTHRSSDRLRSLDVPRGHNVFVCANPMALRGSPGSVEERSDALADAVAAHDAALRALCAPVEDEDLVAACARARSEFLALGSSEGPADLGPLISRLEELTEAVELQQREVDQLADESVAHATAIDGHTDMISALSNRVDVLTECIMRGEGHRVSFTETSTGETHEYECPEILTSARREIVEEARREAGREAREVALQNNGGRAFILFQAFGLLAGPEVRYGNAAYGLPWAVGGELTLGIGLGGAWNIQGGLGLGAAFPDVTGVTNAMVEPHLGFGVMTPLGSDVHFGFGFGGLATLRFLPDGRLAHTIYAVYLEATFRFLAQSEWSPVLTLRGFGGVSPREVSPGNFEVGGAGGGEILIGFGHF
ncbi:hypothetical protein M0Q28_04855 [Patescibacteria group bacterium]|jgi:hypothetical protein|nr:hypothetical protein [Patescibacteria group bacterium]